MVRLCFALLLLRKEQDGIHMPRGFMDDLEGKVVGEKVHEAVLKTVWEQSHVGSNPTPSAIKRNGYPSWVAILSYILALKAFFTTI